MTPWWLVITALLSLGLTTTAQEQPGSIRGVVYDKDFDAPLAAAQILIVETGQATETTDQGNFVISPVAPGTWTLVFAKEGYVRQVRSDVVVRSGELTEIDVYLAGEFTEMDELVVQDMLQLGGATETGLLNLRLESPSIMDSISSELMSRAGASDAASALKLVSGASVQDGKYAVIRGLPDRYVSSQLNGVRLPSADEDKRAVELDQFPAAVIESIQVSKTFTPDQQGDASGGAVDVQLKSIPDETIFQISTQLSANTNARGSDFLTYSDGGVDFWGDDNNDKDIQYDKFGQNWSGAAGVEEGEPPQDYKWSLTAGGKEDVGDGVKIGGLANFFYERDSAFYDDGTEDSYAVGSIGGPLTPQKFQVDGAETFKTSLMDVTQSTESVQWGGLGTVGLETDKHAVGLTYLYTKTTEDQVTLAEDTRGKAYFVSQVYGAAYDPYNPTGPGNQPGQTELAPYLRSETLQYTERTLDSLQLNGRHELPGDGFALGTWKFRAPEVDWILSSSTAKLDQPDKRQFGSLWTATSTNPIFGTTTPAFWQPWKPAANVTLGNFQRIWKTIDEESDQYSVNMKMPFAQWSGDEGYVKVGLFDDSVDRDFNQDTFSNFNDPNGQFDGDFSQFWSAVFPFQNHAILPANTDVDYKGEQDISAWYGMIDLPLSSQVNVIGGARYESTEIGIVNSPEADALWLEPGGTALTSLEPGEADVSFSQDDVLPSLGLVFKPVESVAIRTSYSETVARQTFKELTPIAQQEYLGADIFVGNPDLQMSALENYDVRLDYTPYEGGLISTSWFTKDIEDPIEYVQQPLGEVFTTAKNYPQGTLTGYEVEMRHALGEYWEQAEGLSMGVNATFIDSEVDLPADEILAFQAPGIEVPITKRDMTNAPEHLYNLYFTYDFPGTGTQVSLFYTITGDMLVAGAGQASSLFVPDVYAKEFGTLNLSLSHELSERTTLIFQAKNLTNPSIEEYYSGDAIGQPDLTKSSHTLGREYSIGMTIRF